jgi:hypothetical protein
MVSWAYGIVRADIADASTDHCIGQIHRWAQDYGFDLRGVDRVWSDASYPMLIATLRSSGITAVAVPSLVHVTGWVDVLRVEVDLWTIDPLHCWPRRTASGPPGGRHPHHGAEA